MVETWKASPLPKPEAKSPKPRRWVGLSRHGLQKISQGVVLLAGQTLGWSVTQISLGPFIF